MSPSPNPINLTSIIVVLVWVGFINGFTIYQLVTGKASCWYWQTKSTTTKWWLFKDEQPVAYWFRIAVWSTASLVFDVILLLPLLKKLL